MVLRFPLPIDFLSKLFLITTEVRRLTHSPTCIMGQGWDKPKMKKRKKVSTPELCTRGTMFAAGGLGAAQGSQKSNLFKGCLVNSGLFGGQCGSVQHLKNILLVPRMPEGGKRPPVSHIM